MKFSQLGLQSAPTDVVGAVNSAGGDSQRVGLGNRRNHLRLRALGRKVPRMLPQFRKCCAANSVSDQNSESERGERRAD